MTIDSLFKIDLALYNLLLIPKSFWFRIKYRDSLKKAKENKKLKNSESGKIIYICGNGPSLNKVDCRDLKEDYLVVNDFFKFDKKDPNHPPKFYMVMDDDYILDELKDRLEGVLNPDFETTYLFNGTMMKSLEERLCKSKKRRYYICPWGGLFSSKQDIDFSKLHARTWNIVCEAILFSIYAGYKEIRLLGCDYSVFANNAHFYSNIQEHDNLRAMLYKYCYTTQVHYEIAKYAKKMNVSIINMTKDTLLDAYKIDNNSIY